MKILLLGELSGFHNNLKSGLVKLGHEVFIAGNKDGWKDYSVDINLKSSKTYPFDRIEQILKPIIRKNDFSGYDIVQFAYPLLFNPYFNNLIIRKLICENKKSFLCAISSGDPNYHYGIKDFRYTPFDEYFEHRKIERFYPSFSKLDLKSYSAMLDHIDGVIPSCYDYSHGYKLKNYSKLKATIPYPFNTDNIEFQENKVKGKINIFHGISRPLFKGSAFIIDAMKEVKNKYPNDIELLIVEKVPFNEYNKIFNSCHIFLDQCRSYSYAMNAILAMAKGKIVLSGAEPEMIDELNLEYCPVINIIPDKQQIINAILNLLDNKGNFQILGENSRTFIDNYHKDILVANKYLNTYQTKIE